MVGSMGVSRLAKSLLAVVMLAAISLAASRSASSDWSVLIVSIDTLRADRLGLYGYKSAATPNLDRLAREGIVFDQAFTPAPLTLPAHTSLLTGEYPAAHGVHDNGEMLSATVPTLAEQLHANGLQTAAFVSSFILDRRFGLSRGFDQYWGKFDLHNSAGTDPGTIQIRGDTVARVAEAWLAAHKQHRFFVFVHFYDLHGPYSLPEKWRARFASRLYDGEVSYVDSLVGQLWRLLVQQGLADHTLLVLTADHGEGLGDHGESNHGFFLYRATTQIPLIVRFPNQSYAGKRIKSVVRLIDVAPTICSILGVRIPSSFEGRSLVAEITGRPPSSPSVAYSETLYPYRHFHAAPLFALRTSRYTYIQAPRPELYDSTADRGETLNLAADHPAVVNSLHGQLSEMSRTLAETKEMPLSHEVEQALHSLGYISGSSHSIPQVEDNNSLPDPKDQISLYRSFQNALELGMNPKTLPASASELEQLSLRDPDVFSLHIEAGLARQRLAQDESAISHFREALRLDPKRALAHFDLGVSLANLHRDEEAEKEFAIAIALEPWFSRAYVSRGVSLAHLGKIQEAISSLTDALKIDADDFDALMNRGNLYGMTRDFANAHSDLRRALALDPAHPEVHEALGTLYFYQGSLSAALQEYKSALSLKPSSSLFHSNLGLLYQKLGQPNEAQSEFEQALKLDPANAEATKHLPN